MDQELLADKYPRLFSYALDSDASIQSFMNSENLLDHFALPLSTEAYDEFQLLTTDCTNMDYEQSAPDRRSFVWGKSSYSSGCFYKYMFQCLPDDGVLMKIWKSKCLPKLKVFCWLLINDRLNTRDIMLRKQWHLDSGNNCVLCILQPLETYTHLFWGCDFSTSCWDFIGINWDLNLDVRDRLSLAAINFTGPCFWEIFASTAWNIWKERNDYIFNNLDPSLDRWKTRFKLDLQLHIFRLKSSLAHSLSAWLDNLNL